MPLRLTDLGRLAPLGTAVQIPALLGHFTQAGVSDSISASFAEYGRLGAVAQCSKVKRHLREVIRLKEGVICQKEARQMDRTAVDGAASRAPPPTVFHSFLSVTLHLVKTSSRQEPCSFSRCRAAATSKCVLRALPSVAATRTCLNRPTSKAHKRLSFPVLSVIFLSRVFVCVKTPIDWVQYTIGNGNCDTEEWSL